MPAAPPAAEARSPSRGRRDALLVFAAFSLLWLAQTKTYATSWTEFARLAAIESLVERGTWVIDESPLNELTWDKIFYRGHFYCDKPPTLQAIAAVPYAALHHGFGITLGSAPCAGRWACGYAWITFLVVGLPSAAMLALFHWTVSRVLPSAPWAAGATACLAFATPIWPYSLVFNNHVPAAAGLLASFALLVHAEAPSPARLFSAGLLGGLAASFDLPSAVPALALSALAARHGGRVFALFAAGGAIPALATAALDFQATGSILPPYFLIEGYDYPGAPFPARFAGHGELDDIWAYAFKGVVGDRGVLAHSPILLWGIAGLWIAFRRREPAARTAAAAVALGIGAAALYILTRTTGHGGKSYGERFLIAPMPVLLYFAAFALPPAGRGWRKPLAVAALGIAIGVSSLSAFQGTRRVWGITRPVFYLEQRGRAPYVTACSNFTEMSCIEWGRRLRRLRRQMQNEQGP